MKAWLALRYEQYKRLAPAMNGLVQVATLTLVAAAWLYDYAWSGAWLFPAIFLGVTLALIGLPWAYYDVLGMRIHERMAWLDLDPMQQDRLTPKEAALLALLARALDGDHAATRDLGEIAREGRIAPRNGAEAVEPLEVRHW